MRLLFYFVFLFYSFLDFQIISALNLLKLSQRILNTKMLRSNIDFCNSSKQIGRITKMFDFQRYNNAELNSIIVSGLIPAAVNVPININPHDKRMYMQKIYFQFLCRKALGASLIASDRSTILIDRNELVEWFTIRGVKEKKLEACSSFDLLKLRFVYSACQQQLAIESLLKKNVSKKL